MTDNLADERIATVVLAIHTIIYPRRKRKSGRAFVDLVNTFIDQETRRRLSDGYDGVATMAVISAATRCAEAVRERIRKHPQHAVYAALEAMENRSR